MIDLRYHIVSIMAVFLALGLGILLGSSVVSDPLSAQLNQDLTDARGQRDSIRQERNEATAEVEALKLRMEHLAPWVADGRLDGTRFVLVSDGTDDALLNFVRRSLTDAGAEPFGHIVFEDRLSLAAPADREELIDGVTSIVPACAEDAASDDCFDAASEDLTAEALDIVGRRLGDAVGQILIDTLIDADFLSAPERPDGDWPSSDALVVMLASGRAESAEAPAGALAFTRAVSGSVSTLVATATPDRTSLVTDLRGQDGLSARLSTFDSATPETDPGGLGLFTALVAATEGRGDHFGSVEDRFFAPAPGPD
ncbi:MAG: copper transporter [Actinomycetota bacterium]